jgi:hypothetical protein
LWFRSLVGRSGLDGGGGGLGGNDRARGVRNASEASKTQKTHPYVTLIEKAGIKSETELKSALELYQHAKKLA